MLRTQTWVSSEILMSATVRNMKIIENPLPSPPTWVDSRDTVEGMVTHTESRNHLESGCRGKKRPFSGQSPHNNLNAKDHQPWQCMEVSMGVVDLWISNLRKQAVWIMHHRASHSNQSSLLNPIRALVHHLWSIMSRSLHFLILSISHLYNSHSQLRLLELQLLPHKAKLLPSIQWKSFWILNQLYLSLIHQRRNWSRLC